MASVLSKIYSQGMINSYSNYNYRIKQTTKIVTHTFMINTKISEKKTKSIQLNHKHHNYYYYYTCIVSHTAQCIRKRWVHYYTHYSGIVLHAL